MKKFLRSKKFLVTLLLSVIGLSGLAFGAHTYAHDIDNTPDCDTVAIIKCGAFSRDALVQKYDQNLYGDLQKVYGAFGISRGDLTSGSIYQGVIWRDGRVTIGMNTVVATIAMPAGRWYHPTGDMQYIPGTVRAYKMSTSHFADEGQTAMIWMKDGQFQFAVIKPCSNPVTAKAVKSVGYCDSLSAQKITRNEFRFTAKAHAIGRAEIVGYKFYFGDGNPVTTKSATITHTFQQTGAHLVRVAALVKTFGTTKEVTSEHCRTTVTVTPPPVYTCDDLTKQTISRTIVAFTGSATAKDGAVITNYHFDFGDGHSTNVPSGKSSETRRHEYTKAGTYNAQLTVTFKVDGKTYQKAGPQCAVKVTIQPNPVYSCDDLSAKLISRTEAQFTGKATADHGAKITQYSFDFGDGSNPGVVKTDKTSVTINHDYTKAGTYTARLTVTILVDGQTKQVTSPDCVTHVTVKPAPVYSCDSLTDTKISRTDFDFVGKASADHGATIVSYDFDFGDGSKHQIVKTDQTHATASHSYTEAGTYNAVLTVTFEVNGHQVTASGPQCAVNVQVTEQHQPPVYGCDELSAKLIGYTGSASNYHYTLTYSETGKVTLKSVDFNFGDSNQPQKVTVTDQSGTVEVDHSYAKPGNYVTTATLHFNVKGSVKDDSCQTKISIQPCVYHPGVPAGSNECTPPCVEQGTPTTTSNTPICQHKPTCADHPTTPECTTPPELPSTGPEQIVGSLFGSSALGYGLYSYASSRRTLRNKRR
jgi:PKD repeat protein